jgi:branched-chain amino acid transport system permease protein
VRTAVSRLLGLVAVALLLLAPWIAGSSLTSLSQLEYILCLMLISIGVNIATGYAGQLTLGPGATFGVAAYVCVVLANDYPQTFTLPVICLVGIVTGGIFGLLVGLPALRVTGFYLAVITLFIALALPAFASALPITGATQGISLLANLDFVQQYTGIGLYEIMAVLVLIVVALSWALLHSRLGRKLLVLRTSQELAQSVGHAAYRAKLLAFVLSSLPAGLGAALYVYSQGFVSPGSIPADLSVYLVASCVIGGFGTVWGPVIGTALIFGVQLNTGSLNQYQGLIFGILLALFAILIPMGLIGLGKRWIIGLIPETAGVPEFLQRWQRPVVAGSVPAAGAVSSTNPLELSTVTCQYGGVVALNSVSVTFQPGEIHGLIGSNGSGKTTLLNAICGYAPLAKGTALLGKTRLDRLDPSGIARKGVARTFQTPKLVESLSVLDNVVLAVERSARLTSIESMLRLPRARRIERRARKTALACLQSLGLESYAMQPAMSVPHGQRRLVEVARCMATPAAFVLLDEPAAGLSPSERATLAASIRQLAERGSGVVLIEHDTSFVFNLAQSVTVLHRGDMLASGPAREVRSHPDVVRAYLGESAAAPARNAQQKQAPEGQLPVGSEAP